MARVARRLDLGIVPALRSLAVFHAVAQGMGEDDPPTLILVQPEHPFVSVGYHQEAEREVDLERCAALGLPVYRRRVGGGAVLLDRGQVFFHLVLPERRAPAAVEERYRRYTLPALETYRDLGVPARFRPVNDLEVEHRKIGGTGGATLGCAAVFVGSILLEFDADTMAQVLRVPDVKMRDKLVRSLREYVTCVRRETGAVPDPARVKELLAGHFAAVLGEPLVRGELSAPERELLPQVERELASPEFLHRVRLPGDERPRRVKVSGRAAVREAVRKAPGGLLRAVARVADGRLEEVLVSGDFYVYPQTAWERLPERLRGVSLEREALERAVEGFFRDAMIVMPGVGPQEVVELLRQLAEG
ncbi:MAG: lipoate--protein ligase family protein [Thermaerobacter sp.]|nr:lipoate--protein ligase family protein [Thermaerobacter sp.]